MEQADLFYVGVRKYGLDKGTPWWERLFFRAIYLPFVRFSFKRLHIPAQGTYHPDGSFSWVENIGVATSEQMARQMCKGEFYEIRPIPLEFNFFGFDVRVRSGREVPARPIRL